METQKETKVTRKALQAKLADLNEEYRQLGPEAIAGSSGAIQRRGEISRELRGISEQLHQREPDVTVIIPRSATGHPFKVGEAIFHGPGTYTVKKSVAQYLLWMVDKNREDEVNRMKSNGETFRLRAVGDQASQVDEGRD